MNNYIPKTDAEIKQLAIDLYGGSIFTDRQCPPESLPMVFMPIALGAFKEDFDINKIGLIYEYIDKAGPRSINGMPCFMSFRWINRDDFDRVVVKFNEVKNAMDVL